MADPYFQRELGFFKQTDGVPRGDALSCLISDVFMEDYEEKIQFEIGGDPVDIDWVRYQDGIFFD